MFEGLGVIELIVSVDSPILENPMYQGFDGDNPYEKIEMSVKIMKRSEVFID